MPSGRFDNFKVYDSTANKLIIPSRVQIHDGTSLIDYGVSTSFNTKKISVYDGTSQICLTSTRRDVDIPKYISIGTNKYINLTKSSSNYVQPVSTYYAGYMMEMQLVVNQSTPLYTAFAMNQGDIYQSFYYNIAAEVSGNSVRLVIGSRWYGKVINTNIVINSAYSERRTNWCFNVGEMVSLVFYRNTNSGALTIEVYRDSGNQTYTTDNTGAPLIFSTVIVWNPSVHRIGSKTVNDVGAQSTYGDAKIYSFAHVADTSGAGGTYGFEVSGLTNGVYIIPNQLGSGSSSATCVNTSVYGEQYTTYDRQTI